MAYTSDILRDVKVIIGENENIQPLIDEGDDMSLERDTLLKTLIASAIDKVHRLATANMMRDMTEEAANLDWRYDDKYCQWCELDDDILYISYVWVNGWDRPVTTFINDFTQEYDMCRAAQAGVRPTVTYPACAILPHKGGGMKLEAYPKEMDAETVVRYIPKAKETQDAQGRGQYAIGSDCYWAVIYTIASLYYLSTDNSQRAKDMAAEAADRLTTTNHN